MERTPVEIAPTIEHLTDQVRELERRVQSLEGLWEKAARSSTTLPSSVESPSPHIAAPQTAVFHPAIAWPAEFSDGLVPVFGKAILGVAGAYLVRALTESGTLPGPAAVAATVIYATAWLVSSVGFRVEDQRPKAIYAVAAALIFFPMLWEATTHFKLISPIAAATLLVGFAALGTALAWFRNLARAIWLTALPAAATSIVLIVATGDSIPFVTALLSIAALVEIATLGRPWLGVRLWTAFFTDLGILLLIYLAAAARQSETYQPVNPLQAIELCFVLLGIYLASICYRTAVLRRRIAMFEVAQLAAALALALGSGLWLKRGLAESGAFCLVGAVALYGAALLRFNAVGSERNQHVYSGLGLVLVLVGSSVVLPRPLAAIVWSGLAVASILLSKHAAHTALEIHGALYLAGSAFFSGLLGYAHFAMTAAIAPAQPSIVIWIVAAGAALSCWLST